MSTFSQELKAARATEGHSTARSFFGWLKSKGVSFNYSYYMRLEQGGLPSEKVVQEIASALKGEWADRLILSYCRSLFPKNSYLFPEPADKAGLPEPPSASAYQPSSQKELSPKQVAAIASSESTYHLFLLATLARKPIPEEELQTWFSQKAISNGVKQLAAAGIVRVSGGGIEAVAVEARFPEAYNQEIKDAYARFDKWDETFGEQFTMDFLVNKMLIRRVSGRYLQLIRKQLDLVAELVRSSDEVDTRFNDNVLQLKIVLRQGKLPG